MRCVDDLDTGDLLNRLRSTLLLILLAVTAGNLVHARVFSRWKGRSDVVGNLTRLGGTVAYEANIELNGGAGRLTVVGFDDALDTVASQIRRIMNLPERAMTSGNSSVHIMEGAATTHRLVLLRFALAGKALAIDIEQTNADFLASRTPPSKHRFKALPPFPGSTPKFFAENADTELQIAVNTTFAPAEAVRQFYDQELRAKGWTASLSDAQGNTTSLPLYHRRAELCCVFVAPSESTGIQQITLLHKALGNTTK
jgi:hypothetical protein